MALDLLDRPTLPRPDTSPRAPRAAAQRPERRKPRRFLAWLAVAIPLIGAVLLAIELRNASSADLGEVLGHLQPTHVAWAVAWIAVSLVAAAYNLTAFSAVRVPLRRSLAVQLAISGVRVVTPSAVSTPLVGARFLIRQGAKPADAAATVAVAQVVQLAATVGLVAALAAGSDVAPPHLPGPRVLAIGAAVVVALALVGLVVARHSIRVRTGLAELRRSIARLARHAGHHPARTLGGVVASTVLTFTHVLAFAACVAATGGHVALLTAAAIYLGAASAGSLLPTPGGIGVAEAALIGGLTAAGVALPLATAATLLSRAVAVWAPALPGWCVMLRLRRSGLL